MGSSVSKPIETPEQRRERQIKKSGVLIPPIFAVVHNESNSKVAALQQRISPVAAYDRLPTSPSLVEYLSVTHVGYGLLHDYMTSGMWVVAGDGNGDSSSTLGGSAINTVRASLPLHTNSSSKEGNNNNQGGQISFSSTDPNGRSRMDLRAGTESPMNLFATHSLTPESHLYGYFNANGSGYVGGELGFSFDRSGSVAGVGNMPIVDDLMDGSTADKDDKIHVQLGSWVPLQWNEKATTATTNTLQKQPDSWKAPPEVVHGFLSVDMLGSTAALETKFNTRTLENEVSKYFSIRLNETDTSSSPPLWLTMTSTPKTSSIQISQLLSFDRPNLNILDERAPFIRNTLAWTFQLEKPNNGNGSNSNNDDSQMSMGGVWQFNRAIALKVVGSTRPSQDEQPTMTFGLLMKRWKQPRITCSLLGGFDFQTKKSSFIGIGLEVETDSATLLGGRDSSALYAPGGDGSQVRGDTPETKATLG